MPYLRQALKKLLSALFYHCHVLRARKLDESQLKGGLLVIAPHPDDESLGCGAFIAAHTQKGLPVHVLVVTDGSASTPLPSSERNQLIAQRQEETCRAFIKLGGKPEDIIFLKHPDSGYSAEKTAYTDLLQKTLMGYFAKLQPKTIAAPFEMDSHADHRAIAKTVSILEKKNIIDAQYLYYPMWFWPRSALRTLFFSKGRKAVTLDAQPYLKQKKDAIYTHSSQHKAGAHPKEWHTLDSHLINMQLKPYELYFTLPIKTKKS